tara:strand:- start:385 stop:768 length:384 start_codon:yes stop_codon:yes gene_type:complete
MKYSILFIFIISSILFSKEEHTFKLHNGTKIKGTVTFEDESIFEVDSEFGLVQIDKRNIKKNEYKIYLKSWNVLTGSKISDSENEFIIDTQLGTFTISKDDYYLAIPSIHNDTYLVTMFIITVLSAF